jgi:FMN-dependent NADH-azoreductase
MSDDEIKKTKVVHTPMFNFEITLTEVAPSKNTRSEFKEYVERHPFRIRIASDPILEDKYDQSIMTHYDDFYENYFENYRIAEVFYNALDNEKVIHLFNLMAEEMYKAEMTKRGFDQTLDNIAERIEEERKS